MSEDVLHPCYVCGGAAILLDKDLKGLQRVCCPSCGAFGWASDNKFTAINAWNCGGYRPNESSKSEVRVLGETGQQGGEQPQSCIGEIGLPADNVPSTTRPLDEPDRV